MSLISDRVLRDHVRYTGDGLPNEPVGHPLPVGDPASGTYNPSKLDLREAFDAAGPISGITAAGLALVEAVNLAAQQGILGIGGITAAGNALVAALDLAAQQSLLGIVPGAVTFEVGEDGFAVLIGGVVVLGIDMAGNISGMLGPKRLERGWDRITPPGNLPYGVREAPTRLGKYWQYRVNGEQILVIDNGNNFTPALLNTTSWRAYINNSQSWGTQPRYTHQLDMEDPTGGTRRRVENLRTCDVVTTLSHTVFAPAIPYPNGLVERRAGSTDFYTYASGPVVALRAINPGAVLDDSGTYAYPVGEVGVGNFTDPFVMGDLIGYCSQYFSRLMGGNVSGAIQLQCGRAGTDTEYFEKLGPPIVDNTNNMFTNDTQAINEIIDLVKVDHFDKPLYWDSEFYVQGGADGTQLTPGEYLAHLNTRRADIDSRNLTTSDGGKIWLFIMIGWAAGKEPNQGYQPIDQCTFVDTNASGREVAFGPFNHLKLWQEEEVQSVIHGTAMTNVLIAEHAALAEAHCLHPMIGEWHRFKITNVVHDVANLRFVVTVNHPIAVSTMVIDTDTIEAADGLGFTVRKGSNDAELNVTTTLGDDDTIYVAYTAGALVGETTVLFDHLGYGVAQPDVALWGLSHSACWGNIKREGIYVGPVSHRLVEQWLSPHRASVVL